MAVWALALSLATGTPLSQQPAPTKLPSDTATNTHITQVTALFKSRVANESKSDIHG